MMRLTDIDILARTQYNSRTDRSASTLRPALTSQPVRRCDVAADSPTIWMPANQSLRTIEWRVIPDFRAYEVSEYGHVRRITAARGTTVGLVLRPKWHRHGYPKYELRKDGRTFGREAHRLVAAAFLPPKPHPQAEIAHDDGRVRHNHYSNLLWKSHAENEQDKRRHGTDPRGSRNGAAKLTDTAVVVIRKRRAAGESLLSIANDFGISFQAVSKIARRERWGHQP